MFVNLSDVLNQAGKKVEMQICLEATEFDGSMGSFSVLHAEPMNFSFENSGKHRAKVCAVAKMSFETVCDRCLIPVQTDLEFQIERELSAPDAVLEDEDESRDFMEGYNLDTEALLFNEITVNWPVKILCRDDCKGLCLVCGQNLNEGDCGCDTFVPDPRMAAFKDIFQSNKEV